MWLSIREKFSRGDPGWDKYIDFIGLPTLNEVRTIDRNLNFPINTSTLLATLDLLDEAILQLPTFDQASHYIQIAVNCSTEAIPDMPGMPLELLGYDLSDETEVSSILNCGKWVGELFPFTNRLNAFGLLSYEDALVVKEILPAVWNDDPHSFVDVWAIYELKRS